MSIEVWRNYSSEYIKNLTPTLNSLGNFKNLTCFKEDVWEVVSETDLQAKDIIKNLLKTWITIKDEKNYMSLINLWKKHNILNSNSSFNEINNGKSFILAQNNAENIFPHPITILDKDESWNIIRLWFIESNWTFKSSPLRNSERRINEAHPWISPIPLQIEAEIAKPIQEEKITPKIIEKPDLEYTIKSGDYLWKIISEKYDLKPEKDKNAIWQIMEIIRKDPRNKKAIKDIDTIFTWEKLYLPKNVKLPQWKWKEDKEIILKEKEAK